LSSTFPIADVRLILKLEIHGALSNYAHTLTGEGILSWTLSEVLSVFVFNL
jgi:hypothetical protein